MGIIPDCSNVFYFNGHVSTPGEPPVALALLMQRCKRRNLAQLEKGPLD
jgi:hypothetical protein